MHNNTYRYDFGIVIYSNVHTHSHCLIEESVLMHGSHVGKHCKLRRVIVDSKCNIPAGLTIGYDREQDIANGFRVSEKGITLVTRNMLAALAARNTPEALAKKSA